MVPFLGDKLLLGGDSSLLIFSRGKLQILTKDRVHLVSCISIDDSGIVWTGSLNNTINGYGVNENKKEISAALLFSYSVNSLGNQDYIQCITTNNKRNQILCGTSQNGIVILKLREGKLIPSGRINISSGLSNNNVVSLTWHNDSTLLVGTGRGLDKIIFTVPGDSFYVHNINDYYNFSNTVYSMAKNESGHILLGTEAGLLEIPTVDIEQNLDKVLPIAVSAIQMPGNPDSIINIKKPIELPYNNSGITISYSSPSFIVKNKIRYTYLLAGGNQRNWSKPSNSNHVTFLNLSPGNYRFIVKPVNMYGKVSPSEASLMIIISPAFWQRWWFNLGVVLAVALLLYL
jgi:ligand-binding sensor domain-containing protein